MKKSTKIILSCTLLAAVSLLYVGAQNRADAYQDLFLQKLQTCSPYKTVYKNPITNEAFEKGIIGVKTDSLSHNLHCVYYKQIAKSQYQLCEQRTNALSSDGPFDKKVECRYTNLTGLNDARKEVAQKDYVIDLQPAQIIIGRPQQ